MNWRADQGLEIPVDTVLWPKGETGHRKAVSDWYDSVMENPTDTSIALAARLHRYCFPGGEEAVHGVRGIETRQRGEIRMGPNARWSSFTAEEFVDATCSSFRWVARIGGNLLTSVTVTDAYENGCGRLVLSKGPIPLKKMSGPDVDRGELQRYLGYVAYCPAMLLNHRSLEVTALGESTLRVRDSKSESDISVDVDIDESGAPRLVHCVRPMIVGGRVMMTPWSARGDEFQEHEGMRIPRRLEASWDLPEGSFSYVRIELTSVTVVRIAGDPQRLV